MDKQLMQSNDEWNAELWRYIVNPELVENEKRYVEYDGAIWNNETGEFIRTIA